MRSALGAGAVTAMLCAHAALVRVPLLAAHVLASLSAVWAQCDGVDVLTGRYPVLPIPLGRWGTTLWVRGGPCHLSVGGCPPSPCPGAAIGRPHSRCLRRARPGDRSGAVGPPRSFAPPPPHESHICVFEWASTGREGLPLPPPHMHWAGGKRRGGRGCGAGRQPEAGGGGAGGAGQGQPGPRPLGGGGPLLTVLWSLIVVRLGCGERDRWNPLEGVAAHHRVHG